MSHGARTLPKSERLHSKKLIDSLFGGGKSKAMSAFPIRMVYMQLDTTDESGASQLLVSVPKRLLHRANKRNRVKRQIREAYRKNKHISEGMGLAIALIWLDGKTWPSDVVEQRVENLLTRAKEKAGNGGN